MADISSILAKISARGPLTKAQVFPVPTRTFLSKRKRTAEAAQSNRRYDAKARRDAKAKAKMIKADNAAQIVAQLPEGDDVLHVLTAGDFVFCDLIPAIAAAVGPLLRLEITSLSMSRGNVEKLVKLVVPADGPAVPFHLLLSTYFRAASPKLWRIVEKGIANLPNARLSIAKTHCKVCVLTFAHRVFVIEGSANLRSSRNLEQITIFESAELGEWHRAWIEEAAEAGDALP